MKSIVDVPVEFHISREARDRYRFTDTLFSMRGRVIFANFHAVRLFVGKMNEKRDLVSFPEEAVQAGQINAMGLIDEILHHVVATFREQKNPEVIEEAMEWLSERMGADEVNKTLLRFVNDFPPVAVYRREIEPAAYLEGETEGAPNRLIALEEMIVLWLTNLNPACAPYRELFNDRLLERETAYPQIAAEFKEFFETQPPFGPDSQNLVDMLRSPAIAVPHSLPGQLEYIRERWGGLLGKYLYRLLSSLDLITEEEKMGMLGGAGSGPALIYEFAGEEKEVEAFSPDSDWMPRLVLMAKNTYVWLDQLSKQYEDNIYRLDQIPDEELDALAGRGISGLWLIGLWERSVASRTIKQRCGNPEAVASAYSLFDYEIAGDLGGEEAFQNLKDRAWQRGIRMASDMVPNHVGIDGRWVAEHPDWFISLDHPPFPSYTFSGPDLSHDERVGILLEDHYYDQSDAAVVFKRFDRHTGSEQYIYHGNDGTSMPWSDTAQLNYLNPDLREAVIQKILDVARKFPVIRFDAAMTLAKKHFQRLWFPEPGSGGAIPTRAEHGLTRDQFNALFPKEFWREVVDRIASEVPDTLLLAEAFWLMEGYFVRTLGMHRVYNSAFMNMFKDEENANYRSVMKNTLEFDPEILKRFVNFMSNPDEETAVAQFGKDDKYFGVSTVMVTMPGLPMFGHGQLEGFSEKYGMEYRRAYRDESPDNHLMERHEREIFPLLHRRHLFSGVENFLLYDFYTTDGHVNEDVFAYSNRFGEEGALIFYHNRFASTAGWIRTSASFSVKDGSGDERQMTQRTLGEGLALDGGDNRFTIFREHTSGLEYLRRSCEICDKGFYVELGAYKYQVFLDFREVEDNEWHHYTHLADFLNGRGVPDLGEAMNEILLRPVHHPFKELANAAMFERLMDGCLTEPGDVIDGKVMDDVEAKINRLLCEIKSFAGEGGETSPLAWEMRRKLETILGLPILKGGARLSDIECGEDIEVYMTKNMGRGRDPSLWGTLFGWLFVHSLGKVVSDDDFEQRSRSWIDEWQLGRIIVGALRDLGLDEDDAWQAVAIIKLATTLHGCLEDNDSEEEGGDHLYRVVETLLADVEVQRFIQVNRHKELLWFNKEAFDRLLWLLFITAVVESAANPDMKADERGAVFASHYETVRGLSKAAERSGYQVEKLLVEARGQAQGERREKQ